MVTHASTCQSAYDRFHENVIQNPFYRFFVDFSNFSKTAETLLINPVKDYSRENRQRSLVLLHSRRKKGKFQILGLVGFDTICSTKGVRTEPICWFSLVHLDNDPTSRVKVHEFGPRSIWTRVNSFLPRFVRSSQDRSVRYRPVGKFSVPTNKIFLT